MRVISQVGGDDVVQLLEIRQPHRRAHLIHFPIDPQGQDRIVSRKSEVPHQAQTLRQVLIVGDNRTAFDRVKEFGGVEAQDLGVPEATEQRPLIRTCESVG